MYSTMESGESVYLSASVPTEVFECCEINGFSHRRFASDVFSESQWNLEIKKALPWWEQSTKSVDPKDYFQFTRK